MSLLDSCSALYLQMTEGRKREAFLADPERRRVFDTTHDQITDVMNRTEFFHGTGRYHYRSHGDSKYAGTSEIPDDSLHSFAERGLEPRKDLYSARFTGQDQATLSLTHARMYARVYASLFLEEDQNLPYEYGSRPFWWRYFLGKMILDALTDPTLRDEWKRRKKEGKGEKFDYDLITRWRSSFSKNGKYDRNGYGLMTYLKSTIKRNYPVILGVKSGAMQQVPIVLRSVRTYEARTNRIITPDQFSYIEVPLSRVAETRAAVEAKNLPFEIPVLPMECVELWMGEQSFANIARPYPEQKLLS